MCGRYVRRGDNQRIADWFHAKGDLGECSMPAADYNIAPTTHQPIIRQNREAGERELAVARWGLIPFFTKDIKDVKGISTINARAETIATVKTWREPVRKRRCLVPATAFYEWPKIGEPSKQPYAFEMANGAMFAFAGVWDAWERQPEQLAAIVRDRYHGSERIDGPHSPTHAGDSSRQRLRPLAGPR